MTEKVTTKCGFVVGFAHGAVDEDGVDDGAEIYCTRPAMARLSDVPTCAPCLARNITDDDELKVSALEPPAPTKMRGQEVGEWSSAATLREVTWLKALKTEHEKFKKLLAAAQAVTAAWDAGDCEAQTDFPALKTALQALDDLIYPTEVKPPISETLVQEIETAAEAVLKDWPKEIQAVMRLGIKDLIKKGILAGLTLQEVDAGGLLACCTAFLARWNQEMLVNGIAVTPLLLQRVDELRAMVVPAEGPT